MAKQENIADVLVIGAGASGGAFVWSLAEAGVKVVCLEQGGWVPLNAFPTDQPDSQLHWQSDFHPNPNFRALAEDYPVNESETPISPLMYNAVGGSLIHWGSHFPRFHPSDFRLKTLDGVADDWPMTYQELEPYYDLNDRMHGVSGLSGDPAYPPKPERPCPPLAIGAGGEAMARGFNKLGWHWWCADNAVPSVHYDGREPDYGGYLRSFTSSDIIYWPKALLKGAQLKTHADGVVHQRRNRGFLFVDRIVFRHSPEVRIGVEVGLPVQLTVRLAGGKEVQRHPAALFERR